MREGEKFNYRADKPGRTQETRSPKCKGFPWNACLRIKSTRWEAKTNGVVESGVSDGPMVLRQKWRFRALARSTESSSLEACLSSDTAQWNPLGPALPHATLIMMVASHDRPSRRQGQLLPPIYIYSRERPAWRASAITPPSPLKRVTAWKGSHQKEHITVVIRMLKCSSTAGSCRQGFKSPQRESHWDFNHAPVSIWTTKELTF